LRLISSGVAPAQHTRGSAVAIPVTREPTFGRNERRATAPEPSKTPPSPGDLAVLQCTGGTTGVSKGAMLTHANLAANLQQTGAWFTGTRRGHEVMLTALPLFHSFGMTAAMNFPVSMAAAMVVIPDPRDIKAIVRSIVDNRVTLLPAVPAIFNSILTYPNIERLDLRSVQRCFSGSAPLFEALQYVPLTGSRIVEGAATGTCRKKPRTRCATAGCIGAISR